MELYLIRHADAEPLAPPIEADEDRPLTPKGLEQCRQLAHALGRWNIQVEKLCTSPLLRAKQTAEELVKHWHGAAPTVEVVDALAPGAKPKGRKRFFMLLEGQSVGVVGHQPDLGELIGWLIGGKKAEIRLAKGGAARVDCPEGLGKGTGVLAWLANPELYVH
jgi:phosphohistidine phosphatase